MDNIRALLVYGLLLSAVASPRALCAEYSLMPSPATVHIGNFNAALKPVLTINSGDIVTIETAATTIESEAIDQSGVVPPSDGTTSVLASRSAASSSAGASLPVNLTRPSNGRCFARLSRWSRSGPSPMKRISKSRFCSHKIVAAFNKTRAPLVVTSRP